LQWFDDIEKNYVITKLKILKNFLKYLKII